MKKWEVLKNYIEGKEIECKGKKHSFWQTCVNQPLWSWEDTDYRVKGEEVTEIDWTKVPVDTPVIVYTTAGTPLKRYFSHVTSKGKVCVFFGGTTKRTSNKVTPIKYETAELDLGASSIINWVPNTGETPLGNVVLVTFNDGSKSCHLLGRGELDFSLNNNIISYAVIT